MSTRAAKLTSRPRTYRPEPISKCSFLKLVKGESNPWSWFLAPLMLSHQDRQRLQKCFFTRYSTIILLFITKQGPVLFDAILFGHTNTWQNFYIKITSYAQSEVKLFHGKNCIIPLTHLTWWRVPSAGADSHPLSDVVDKLIARSILLEIYIYTMPIHICFCTYFLMLTVKFYITMVLVRLFRILEQSWGF